MKGSNQFQNVIKAYLDSRALSDKLFAVSYEKKNKSIEECCQYIISEVRNMGIEGVADDEVYSMAVHYYDEEELEINKSITATVVVNKSIPKSIQYVPKKTAVKKKEVKEVVNTDNVQLNLF